MQEQWKADIRGRRRRRRGPKQRDIPMLITKGDIKGEKEGAKAKRYIHVNLRQT